MRFLKSNLLWFCAMIVFSTSAMLNGQLKDKHIETYRAIEQNTSKGTKLINVSSKGEVFNAGAVYSMAGGNRLNEINARYTRNTAAIRDNKQIVRLESNNINRDNVVAECMKFLKKNSTKLGIDLDNLRFYNVMTSNKMFTVVFQQTHGEHIVKESFVRMYVFPDGRIQTFSSMYYDDIPNINIPKYANLLNYGIKIEATVVGNIYSSAILGLDRKINRQYKQYRFKLPTLVILPVFNGNGYTYKYVYEVDMELPGIERYIAYIDAETYELIQRTNLVYDLDVKVESKHYGDNVNQPLITGPMRNMEIEIEGVGSKRTNSSGMLLGLPDDVIGKKWTTKMVGNHATIKTVDYPTAPGSSGSKECKFEGTITADGIQMYDSNNFNEMIRTIFNNVSTVRSYYYSIDPSSQLLSSSIMCYAQILTDDKLEANVEFNAYASGDGTMGFLAANHKNVFMGKLNKVLFHEYGHSMVFSKFTEAGQKSGMRSKLANEANADITAAFITGDPEVFNGIVKTGMEGMQASMNLYRTCNNDYIYPNNIEGEGHYDSQILSGAFWDFKVFAGEDDFNDVKAAVHFAKEYFPDGYTVEEVFATWFDALVRAADRYKPEDSDYKEFEYLFEPIYHAFKEHNIGFNMLINYKFKHSNVADQSDASKPVSVSCEILDFAAPNVLDEVYVNYYTNFSSEVKSVLLTRQTSNTGNTYKGEIPAQEDGARVSYYFSYKDPISGGIDVINRDYFYFSGYKILHRNDCETAGGWTILNADADKGFSFGVPTLIATVNQTPWNHILYSPGYSADGSRCLSTSINVSYDNKGDATTQSLRNTSIVESPLFSFTDDHIYLTYQRWHISRMGGDINGLFVEVSFDGGNTWKEAKKHTGRQFNGRLDPKNWEWQREYVNLTKFRDAGEDFSNMKVRFRAYANNNSIGLNILIDDIALLGTNNPNKIADNSYINELIVSPNPVSNEATLTFPKAVFNPEISIQNTLGYEVLNVKLQGEYNFAKVNTLDLSNGVYLLQATSEGKIYQTKLIIAK